MTSAAGSAALAIARSLRLTGLVVQTSWSTVTVVAPAPTFVATSGARPGSVPVVTTLRPAAAIHLPTAQPPAADPPATRRHRVGRPAPLVPAAAPPAVVTAPSAGGDDTPLLLILLAAAAASFFAALNRRTSHR
ncbi:MAG: hypothetical protein JO363_22910 [Solirubrobacterales bacterium]|nr:hypothetical protein [Solirubrobacterales bacterium]